MNPRAELPDSARCVIVGGGVGGTSIAYHLAKLGYEDVVLLERAELTSGSTFHSAGLVGQLRGSVTLTKMMMHSVEVYRGLATESELDPGWVECGGIRLASSEERLEELRRQAGWAKTFGLPLELISAAEAQERFPLMSTDGVLGGAWLPTDGYIDPSQLTYALADVARREGDLTVFQNARVTGIEVADGRVRAVETERGRIEAEVVVNAGGMYAAEIGRMAGIRVPVIPMSHQYLVTQPFREHAADERLPTLRDPDLLVYYREDGGGLVMGGYEHDSAPAFLPEGSGGLDAIPHDFNGRLLEDDFDRFAEIIENSKRRVPAMEDVKVTKLINGPEAFTPDNEFCLGESEVRGLFVAAGFCAHGLAGAGGIGMVIAEWIAEGEPSLDLWEMDVRRFGSQYRSPAYTHARIRETYETYYDIRYPNHERRRAARCAPRRRRRGTPTKRPRSARSQAGSGSTGTRPTRPTGTSRCARAAGRDATGRRRSAPSTAPPASAWPSSTSRRSRRWRSRGAARRSWSSGSATTASPARSARSPTRRCSTGAAASSATSPSPGWVPSCSRSSPGRRSETTTASGCESTCRTTAASRCATSRPPGRASGFGGRRRARCSRPLLRPSSPTRRFPT